VDDVLQDTCCLVDCPLRVGGACPHLARLAVLPFMPCTGVAAITATPMPVAAWGWLRWARLGPAGPGGLRIAGLPANPAVFLTAGSWVGHGPALALSHAAAAVDVVQIVRVALMACVTPMVCVSRVPLETARATAFWGTPAMHATCVIRAWPVWLVPVASLLPRDLLRVRPCG
jgi:hypothetical protein